MNILHSLTPFIFSKFECSRVNQWTSLHSSNYIINFYYTVKPSIKCLREGLNIWPRVRIVVKFHPIRVFNLCDTPAEKQLCEIVKCFLVISYFFLNLGRAATRDSARIFLVSWTILVLGQIIQLSYNNFKNLIDTFIIRYVLKNTTNI